MATPHTRRATRTLTAFFAVLALAFGLVAVVGQWKPNLGLDLQGGTRITLIAKDDPSASSLAEAKRIVDDRVNGSGVSESEVKTQGDRFIVVEIPGESRRDLVETVKRQAQLRFRLVARTGPGVGGQSGTTPDNGLPSGPAVTPEPSVQGTPAPQQGENKPKNSAKKNGAKKSRNQSRNRPGLLPARTGASPYTADDDKPGKKKQKKQNDGSTQEHTVDDGHDHGSEVPTAPVDPAAPATQPATPGATPGTAPGADPSTDPLTWMDNPDPAWVQQYEAFTCPETGTADIADDPDQPLITCDTSGMKYLLSAAAVEGSDLSAVDLLAPGQQQVEWGVSLQFDRQGTGVFADISEALYNTGKQFAIVLDGEVISAPTMNGLIRDGKAEITGDFDEAGARGLTTSLKYGSLPIAFEADPPVETVGPSLAGEQLDAGVLAGVIGLLLVMLYCLFYYRGLGVVVLASLVVAGAATYALVMLLSKSAGFTLTLPGVAGLIVAVGITADSFIVYFERIRDEMRDGKSMRVAIESGWKRARATCLAADAVSLLAAVVLYIFAAGVVKGFAFALGLSTLVDLAVFFWFTHPMVTLLGSRRFFNSGHRFSGLSAESLGVDRLGTDRPGGPGSDRLAVGGRA